jgi:hypothetical protein
LDAILHKETILVSFELKVFASAANRQKFWSVIVSMTSDEMKRSLR